MISLPLLLAACPRIKCMLAYFTGMITTICMHDTQTAQEKRGAVDARRGKCGGRGDIKGELRQRHSIQTIHNSQHVICGLK